MTSNKLQGLLALTLAAALSAGTALAQDAKTTINVGTITTYPPLEFKDPQTGELTGFNHDVMEAIAAKAGLTINWVEAAWAEQASFAPLKVGRMDVATGVMVDNPEKRADVSYLDFMNDPYTFYTTNQRAGEFTDLTALCGKRVAMTRGSSTTGAAVERWNEENCVKAGKPPLEQQAANSTPDQQLMLKQGRVDAGFTAKSSFAQAKLTGVDEYTALGEPLVTVMYGFPFLATNTELGDKLKAALDEVIADGTYGKLIEKWKLTEDSSIGTTATINAGK